jgi:4-amino-4-deoxy-L-arabinose transferase-like glycosyltransferase
VRDAVGGGWAKRGENAIAWFLITWVAFIFLFFTKSQSKLIGYILPVFPALAVLVGNWLAGVIADPPGVFRLRWCLRIFSFVCGLLAAGLLLAVLRPGLILRDPEQAIALRTPAIILAAILLAGGLNVPILARLRGGFGAFAAITAMAALFLAGLTFAVPNIYKPGTKELALIVKGRVQPGDRVMHYFDFFHDFTFYAGRTVDLVAATGELELIEDKAARDSGRFMSEAEFRALWTQPGRIYVVAKKRDVERREDGQAPLFADPTFHYHLLGQTRDHYLFSNQP